MGKDFIEIEIKSCVLCKTHVEIHFGMCMLGLQDMSIICPNCSLKFSRTVSCLEEIREVINEWNLPYPERKGRISKITAN